MSADFCIRHSGGLCCSQLYGLVSLANTGQTSKHAWDSFGKCPFVAVTICLQFCAVSALKGPRHTVVNDHSLFDLRRYWMARASQERHGALTRHLDRRSPPAPSISPDHSPISRTPRAVNLRGGRLLPGEPRPRFL